MIGCCAFAMPMTNIRCISIGNKYHLHWPNSSLNAVNCAVIIWPNFYERKMEKLEKMLVYNYNESPYGPPIWPWPTSQNRKIKMNAQNTRRSVLNSKNKFKLSSDCVKMTSIAVASHHGWHRKIEKLKEKFVKMWMVIRSKVKGHLEYSLWLN